GALSYAVARAIEGAADRQHKGVLTRGALYEYARQVVSHLEDKQVIYTRPEQADKLQAPIFRTSGILAPKPVSQNSLTRGRPLRIAIDNGNGNELSNVQKSVTPFVTIPRKEDADIVWDRAQRLAFAKGDVLARDVDAADIPAVVDRFAASGLLARLSEDRP